MVDRSSIRQTLIQFLQEDTAIETANISDSTALNESIGLDSIDFVGLVMRIEGHYRIRMSKTELETLNNVGDLLALIESKLVAPAMAA